VILTTEERDVVDAVASLSPHHQRKVAALFHAQTFGIALLSGPSDREKLRDWIESTINAAPGTDLPPGVANLRGAVRRLRVSSGDKLDG